ncbi:MAG: glutaminyl-peptide cyclotransferase [Lentisphaerales bacterium]|nr:glutaminyl-peptide cyclotransferase [Lentisphaerales bacterium]
MKLLLAVTGLILIGYVSFASNKVPVYKAKIINTYPHDSKAFTQGLIYHEGFLYESTGLRGESSLRKVKLKTGEVLQKRDLQPKLFGEGLAIWKNQLIQLTWHAGVAFVCDIEKFNVLKAFAYSGEGWGLTANDDNFIMSDGSAELRFLDPKTFKEVKKITVTDEDGKPVKNLNELEFIDGEIFANVWMKNKIARIGPESGKVNAWIDLIDLVPPEHKGSDEAVLNGIAYDSKNDRLFVTGKLWPELYEIKISK